jgi:hypothetical protein
MAIAHNLAKLLTPFFSLDLLNIFSEKFFVSPTLSFRPAYIIVKSSMDEPSSPPNPLKDQKESNLL